MPALLRIKRYIDNDIWNLTFTLAVDKLPESDKELMRKFGEPEINIGGTFLADTANAYTLPDKYVKVRSDLPYTQQFDSKTAEFGTNTQVKVLAFQDDFVAKYSAAFTALRESVDTFTGEFIENI